MEFWKKKFDDNVRRDAVVKEELQKRGIKCLIVWECTIRRMMKDDVEQLRVIEAVKQFLIEDISFIEL